MRRFLLVGFTVSLLAVGLTGWLAAQAMSSGLSFDIKEGAAATTLKEFATQAHLQLLFDYRAVQKLKTSAVKGQLAPLEALKEMLSGSGFTFREVNDHTIAILAPAAPTSKSLQESSSSVAEQESTGGSSVASLVAQATSGQTAISSEPSPKSSESEPASALQEVIVTAQKRAERAIDVPISMVVLTSDDLEKRNILSLDDLTEATPGLSIQSVGTQRRIMLRGISNIFGNSALIGLYLDDASVTSAAAYNQLDLSTYDVERVEVLRGPQGTLYGEGSVGGTLRFITKNPELDHFALDADVAASFTQGGDPSERIQSVVNIPLVTNELGLRVVSEFDRDGGWIDQPAANLTNFNGVDLTNVRVKGLWTPNSQFTVTATGVIYRRGGAPDQGEDSNGNFTQVFNLTTTPHYEDDYDLGNLTLTYDFSGARLLSTTTFIKDYLTSENMGNFYEFSPPGTPFYEQYTPSQSQDTDNLSQELRLTAVSGGPWQWTLGAFARRLRFDYFSETGFSGSSVPLGAPLPNPSSPFQWRHEGTSSAVFGDTSYRFGEQLTLGAGLRYFRDDENAVSGTPPLNPPGEAQFSNVDPRLYAQYKLGNDANVYASAAKGFRSGGINFFAPTAPPGYGPETVWTYELGTKVAALHGALSVDADVFYSAYSGYQIVGVAPPPAPPQNIYRNAGDALIRGIETSIDWRMSDLWTLSLAGDYLETAFTTINLTPSSAAYQVGDPLDLVPPYQYNVSLQRNFLVGGKSGFLRLDYNQQARETFRNRSIGPWYFSESDVIYMLNFKASLLWSDRLSLGFFAQNLLNDRGYTSPVVIEQNAARATPRTIGVQFGVKLD